MIIVLMLIYYHSARVFDNGDFYVKNQSLSFAADVFTAFGGIWAMPLLFFVAGASMFYALRMRSGREFASERTKRLLAPFAFGYFLIAAPQIFLVYFQKPGNAFSCVAFWKYQFSVPIWTRIVAGNVGDAHIQAYTWEPAHLWFILYLLVFCLATLPLMQSFNRGRLRATTERIAGFCQHRPWALFLFALPLMVVFVLMMRLREDIGRFFLVVPFIYGFMMYSDRRFGDAIDMDYKFSLWTAAVTTTILGVILGVGGYDIEAGWAVMLWAPWAGLEAWLWMVGLLGLARKHLNFKNRFLEYTGEMSYPFYILHQLLIVYLAYGIIRIAVPSVLKYLLLSTAALVLTVGTYDLLIKRLNPLRWLFGMRLVKKLATEHKPATESDRATDHET